MLTISPQPAIALRYKSAPRATRLLTPSRRGYHSAFDGFVANGYKIEDMNDAARREYRSHRSMGDE
jgi:hypothetical protein